MFYKFLPNFDYTSCFKTFFVISFLVEMVEKNKPKSTGTDRFNNTSAKKGGIFVLFPAVIKQIFCADRTGAIKARVRTNTAVRAIKSGRARKISDNFIQYRDIWSTCPLELSGDEIVLINTISRFTKKSGWLKVDNPEIVQQIFEHNKRVVTLLFSGVLDDNTNVKK